MSSCSHERDDTVRRLDSCARRAVERAIQSHRVTSRLIWCPTRLSLTQEGYLDEPSFLYGQIDGCNALRCSQVPRCLPREVSRSTLDPRSSSQVMLLLSSAGGVSIVGCSSHPHRSSTTSDKGRFLLGAGWYSAVSFESRPYRGSATTTRRSTIARLLRQSNVR